MFFELFILMVWTSNLPFFSFQGISYYDKVIKDKMKAAGSTTDNQKKSETQKKVNVDPNIYCHLGHLHLLLEDFPKGEC